LLRGDKGGVPLWKKLFFVNKAGEKGGGGWSQFQRQ